MKNSKLLVLTALWLGMGSSAMAEVPDNVWTMPEPSGLEVVANPSFDGTHYVLYNPAAKMFFASGNDWNTRASVATFGYEVWFTDTEESGNPANPRVAPEGSYFFNDDCQHPDRILGAKDLFTDGGGATWVDRDPGNASQTDFYWSVTKVGDFYRIQNTLFASKEGNEGKFIGWKSGSDTRLNMILPEEGTVDWQFVTAESYMQFTYGEAYEEYKAKGNAYFSGAALEASLKAAEELNIDIEEWLAVYTNKESTKEELDAAKTAVDAVVTNKKNLQKIVDRGAVVNAPIGEAQLILANSSATAEELKAAIDTLTPIVEAREALKKALDEAKQAGFEATAAYDAVYNNQEATTTELKKALEDLSAEVIEWGKGHATWDKPADMSSKIVNPNFDNASPAGWSGTVPNMTGSGAHGPANVAEVWNNTFDTYQDIEGLPAGVYALSAQTMWRGSWADFQNKIGPAAFLYAKAGDVESKVPFNYAYGPLNTESMAGDTPWGVGAGEQNYVDEASGNTYYIPNDPSCFRLYAEKGLYDTKVLFVVKEGETVRIGVKNPAKMGDADNWTCFDTFMLTYYGNGADACQNYVNEAMKNFGEYQIEEGTLYTASYLTAYQQAYQGEKTASSMAEVEAIIGGINQAKADLDKNIELWKTWSDKLEKAYKLYTTDPSYQALIATGALADYYEMDENEEGGPGKETILENLNLTNEQLQVEIERVDKYEADILDEFKNGLKPGTDVTNLLKNPDFESGVHRGVANPSGLSGDYGTADGWHADKFASGNFTPGPDGKDNDPTVNHAFEAWHCHDFDLWQEVKDVPEGVYVIEVQGYVRNETAGTVTEYDPSIIPIKLYMNKSTSNFPDVFSEEVADEHYVDGQLPKIEDWSWSGAIPNYPNSMGAAGLCFDWGMYKVSTFGLVKAGDPMRIGVKGKMNNDWWCIWDNFKLTYQGYEVSYVEPALDQALTQISTENPMSKTLYAQASSLNSRAAEAKATGDGKTMFQMLSEITDIADAINTSVALFAELNSANEAFYESLANYDKASAAAMSAATTLYNTISNGIQNFEFEDADVEGLLTQIKEMRTKLAFPEGWENAKDDEKVDCSLAIQSNSFFDENNYVNTSEGWKNAGNLGNDETQKGAQAMEFWQIAFDMSQEIIGLPEGTYVVQADAWCRIGGNDENYTAWQADPAATMAFLYAVDGDSVVYSTPVANIMKAGDALFDATGYEGEAEFTINDNTYYLPGSLVSGKGIIEINEGIYTNKVVAKVKKDGKLTIGIKKAEEKTNSWVVCDDFKLFYCGTNSSLTPDDDASGINTINEPVQVKIEYFTLDGRKTTRAQKGIMIQKMTLGNGATIVRKVQK